MNTYIVRVVAKANESSDPFVPNIVVKFAYKQSYYDKGEYMTVRPYQITTLATEDDIVLATKKWWQFWK